MNGGDGGPPVNSTHGEWNVLAAPDGSFLVFESAGRATNVSSPGDLYVSFRKGSGWSEPANLAELNGAGSDLAARLSADGERLIFVSTSHPGSGEADVFAVPLSVLERYRPRPPG